MAIPWTRSLHEIERGTSRFQRVHLAILLTHRSEDWSRASNKPRTLSTISRSSTLDDGSCTTQRSTHPRQRRHPSCTRPPQMILQFEGLRQHRTVSLTQQQQSTQRQLDLHRRPVPRRAGTRFDPTRSRSARIPLPRSPRVHRFPLPQVAAAVSTRWKRTRRQS